MGQCYTLHPSLSVLPPVVPVSSGRTGDAGTPKRYPNLVRRTLAMGMLIDGKWSTEWYKPDEKGRFVREPTRFHDRVTADGTSGFKAEAGRYHLYVSLACPWAHRTLILRKLKGLEKAITVSVVHPIMGDDGWNFGEWPGSTGDTVNGLAYMREVYVKANPNYTGRVTVPVLWDKEKNTIVNNESCELIRMLDHEFGAVAENDVDFCPPDLKARVEETIQAIYDPINNGVYRAGFSVKQAAYEEAVTQLFEALDHWEGVLGTQRYLCGDRITEADWCLFTTLYRFDPVYVSHFKCNLRRIIDYPNLWNFTKELYQHPGVRETCNLDHIKTHYFRSHPTVNPTGIVPKGPLIDHDEPHDRDRL
jgi:glutathionyl-hydroquinone reductase